MLVPAGTANLSSTVFCPAVVVGGLVIGAVDLTSPGWVAACDTDCDMDTASCGEGRGGLATGTFGMNTRLTPESVPLSGSGVTTVLTGAGGVTEQSGVSAAEVADTV